MLARASLPHAHTTNRRAHGRLKYHRRDAPFLFTAARPAARGPGARHHCHCARAVAASRRPPHPLGARRDRRRLPSMRAATRTSTSVCTRSASAPRCDAPYAMWAHGYRRDLLQHKILAFGRYWRRHCAHLGRFQDFARDFPRAVDEQLRAR